MNAVTLNDAINTAIQLSPDQQDMLIDILTKRRADIRRQEIASDANQAIAAFREGKFKAQSAEEAIAELHRFLEDDE